MVRMVKHDDGTEAVLPSDEQLILDVRDGHPESFGQLYERHANAAKATAATHARNSSDAADLVAEAFANVLGAIRSGSGPTIFFRAYLLTTLRRLAAAKRKKDNRQVAVADPELYMLPGDEGDPAIAGFEREVVGRSFRGLPERWQAVLWYTEVDEMSPAAIAPLLGISPNAVAALAVRAREGLRQGYLQNHISTAGNHCQEYAGKLGAYARGGLTRRREEKVEAHLNTCPSCTALLVHIRDVGVGMRGVIFPAIVGFAFSTEFIKAAAGAASLGAAGVQSVAGASAPTGVGGTAASAAAGAGMVSAVAATTLTVVAAGALVAVAMALPSGNDSFSPPAASSPQQSQPALAQPFEPGVATPLPAPSVQPSDPPTAAVTSPTAMPPAVPADLTLVSPAVVPEWRPAPEAEKTASLTPEPSVSPTPTPSPTPNPSVSPTPEPTVEPTLTPLFSASGAMVAQTGASAQVRVDLSNPGVGGLVAPTVSFTIPRQFAASKVTVAVPAGWTCQDASSNFVVGSNCTAPEWANPVESFLVSVPMATLRGGHPIEVTAAAGGAESFHVWMYLR